MTSCVLEPFIGGFDIALVRLSQPFDFSGSNIDYAYLSGEDPTYDTDLYASGWGRTTVIADTYGSLLLKGVGSFTCVWNGVWVFMSALLIQALQTTTRGIT